MTVRPGGRLGAAGHEASPAEEGGPSTAPSEVAEYTEPEPASPAGPADRLRSPALQGGIAFLVYLTVWVGTAFRPIIERPAQALLYQHSMDPNLFTWILRWWPYAIAHGLNPLYTHEVGTEVGHNLAWVTTVPPLGLLAAPLTVVAGPLVSFSLLDAIAMPLSAWAAFVLCRRLTGKFWPGLVGGAVLGFSAYEMNHVAAGQLNLAYSLLLPILAYLVVVWRDGSISTRSFVILAGLTMAVQFYLSVEIFADLTAILAVCLLVGFALAGREGRPLLLRLARFVGLAYAIAAVLAAPYAAYMLTVQAPQLKRITGMDLASLVIPRPERTFGIVWLAHAAAGPTRDSATCYVGVPLLLVVVLLAVTSWSSKIVRFLSCMLVLVIVASFGPVLHLEGRRTWELPWAALFHIPLVRNSLPLRLMVFAYLVLAVATALWLAGPAKRVPWARWALGVLVVVFLALDTVPINVSPHPTVPAFITSGQYRQQLSPGEVVVVVSGVGNAGMLWQAESDFYMRVDGGYFTEGVSHRTDLPLQVQQLASISPARVWQFERYVSDNHVGAILVDASHRLEWTNIFRKLGLVGHLSGGVIVYQTDGCQSCHAPVGTQPHKKVPSAT
ncbi:MAG TPA: hypothetical protein VMA32_02925 [Streptosporangiaceae bacterium]|nr:hypothetical protein [Streptosporangiaceae bacterium]